MTEHPQPTFGDQPSGWSQVGIVRRMTGWLQDVERRRTALCVTILAGLVFLFYYRLWWPELVMIKRDTFRFFGPIRQYVAQRLLGGELPEWFPYESLGRSVIGPAVGGVFHPFTTLSLLLPAHDALRLSVLVACLLGVVGAFVLGRTYNLSRAGSVIAAAVFVCSGYAASLTEHIQYHYSLCLLPLFCVSLARAVEGKLAWLVAAAALWASVFLYGDIQTGYYYGFIGLFVAVNSPGAPAGKTAMAYLACAAVLAGLLAGIQLGPSIATFQGSERAHSELFYTSGLSWSTHPLRLLTMIASPVGDKTNHFDIAHFFFGSNPAGTVFVGTLVDSLYVGLPAVGLALMGAWARRDLRWIALVGCLALWLALGKFGWLYEAFSKVMPFWSVFRYPEKLMGVVTFSVAMLAGAGIDTIRERRAPAAFWAVLVVLCLGLGSIALADATESWIANYFGTPFALAHDTARSLAHALFFGGAATLGVALVILAFRFSRLPEQLLLGLLAVIILLDLSRVGQEAYHTGPADLATFTPTLVQVIEQHAGVRGAGHFRIFSNPEVYTYSPLVVQEALGFEGNSALNLKQALQVDLNAPFEIESITVYMPGQSVDLASLRDITKRNFDIWARVYARYNVRYLIGLEQHFSSPPLSRSVIASVPSYGIALTKNPFPVKPRAYLSRRPQAIDSHVSVEGLATNPEFLAGAVDLIETKDKFLSAAREEGRALITLYEPQTVRVQTETATPAVLILLDAFEAGWRASLEDGHELPIWRANALVRAVAVPAGTHHVTFTYRTPLLVVGAWFSVAGLFICAGLLWLAWRSERRRRVS